MTRCALVLTCVIAFGSAACNRNLPEAAKNLPPGDPEKGRQAFVALQCHACHEVAGGGLPAPSVVPAVALGGTSLLPPSREDIAADILLPSSHFAQGYPRAQITVDGQSRMPDYSKALTEDQLANLSAFLKSRYTRGLPSPTR